MVTTRPKRFTNGLASAALLAAALLGNAPTAARAQAGPFEVVATGLDNPRGLAFGKDGALYVAEAGVGGKGPCVPQIEREGEKLCFGLTGAVTRIAAGKQERILSKLPSLGEATGAAIGAQDVLLDDKGKLFAVMGLHSIPDQRQTLGDAGANALYSVGPSGKVETLAVFPAHEVDAPPFLQLAAGTKMPMQSVPASVAVGPNGAIYVGELTGFPFEAKSARIFLVARGKAPQVYAEGFTNIIDLAFGPDGSLYVLEIAANGFLNEEQPGGALIRVSPKGDCTVIASAGLVMPTALAIGPDGAAYVSNFGVMPGQGEVIRIKVK